MTGKEIRPVGWPPELKLPKNLERRWRQRSRFLMDMASTDHKFYYPDANGPQTAELFEALILGIHSLPGYFMCIYAPFAGGAPFMNLKRGGKSFDIVGLKNVVYYVNAVLKRARKGDVGEDDIRAVRRIVRMDPGFEDFIIKETVNSDDK
jgi:hypothetical protein